MAEQIAPALDFIGALPTDRWVIVRNSSKQGMKDLISEYNRRNLNNSLQCKVKTADNGSVMVRRLQNCKGTGNE
jgi:hypothetical protein